MSRKSSTETLIAAMRILARDIQSGDGVANAAISEAADRLKEQQARINELESPVTLSEWQELERQVSIGWRAVEMLSDIDRENSRRKGLACCPSCGDWDGHHALCELAAILREYSGVIDK